MIGSVTDVLRLEVGSGSRRLFDADVIGIFFVDGDGRIVRANRLFLRMIGYTENELPLCLRALTPPEWRALDRAKTRELREHGRVAPWEKELYHREAYSGCVRYHHRVATEHGAFGELPDALHDVRIRRL